MKNKTTQTAKRFAVLAAVIAVAELANAGIIVTRGHIVGGSATGTLVAIDSPFISIANGTTGSFGGPVWTTGGTIYAHPADQGFAAPSSPSGDGIREFDIAGTPWEPDGTPFSQARGYYIYPDGPSPGTTWTFNLASSGIDLPDGTVIHGVYARFGGRNNDRARYEYTEGTSSANLVLDQFSSGSAAHLVLRWFDADGNPRDSNFQRVFSNPITVTGGDGFQLRITDTTLGNAGHIDAIVLDTSLPKANDVPAVSTLLPVDNKTSVVPWTSLEATFDEPVALTGSGTVTITDLTDGSSTRVINLPDPQVTSPNGDDLLIKPATRLELGTQYSVKISADALVDLAANPFTGILDDTTWNFSTRSVPNQLHNVLIVTAALADAPPNATAAQATNLLFHDPRNVDEAMRAASYGQIGLNLGDNSGLPGTVALSYPETLAQQKTAGGSTNLKNRMAASLAALGYNTSLSNFRFIIYIQPAALNTGNDGWANLFSNTSVYLAPFNLRLAMHEMGHCLGGNHSNGSDFGCSLGGADVDYNASKKILFGWLNAFPGSVVNLPANTGTSLTLAPLSRSPAVMPGVRAVRVPNPNGGTATYLVSYKIDDGPYNTLQNSSYSRKVHVTEDAGGSATTHRATLGAGQEYIVGKLKVRCDSIASDSLSAAVTISVNAAPVALAQSATTSEDASSPIVLVGTDTDLNPLTYTVLSQPAKGTLSGTAPNLTYTPHPNLNGADSFTFKVNDGFVDSATATVTVNITPVDDAPVAQSQDVATAEDNALSITLAGTDIENSALTYNIVTPPANGTLSGTAPNLSYSPNADFNGTDSFAFTANDGAADSGLATVSITVNPVNDAPTAIAQNASTDEDSSLPLALGGIDPDGDPLTYAIVSQPANGTLSGTAPNLSYSPNENFNGTDSFAFTANDGTTDSGAATVSITVSPINDAPTAIAQNTSTDEDSALPLALGGIDPDGDPLTYAIVTQPANGTLSGTAPNLSYSPNADFNGTDSFAFTANDGTADSGAATVSITVNPVNDAPTFSSALISPAGASENVSYVGVNLAGSATDVDAGDALTYSKASGPVWLNIAADGTLTGTPPAGSAGLNTFVVTATDSGSATAEATLQIAVTVLPLPWTTTDIGTGILAGSATFNSGTFTQKGSGMVAAQSDGLNFTYQTLSGDGSITARISILQNTGNASHIGVMIRDTLASNSKQIFMGMSGTQAFRWTRRTGTGATASFGNSGTGVVPNTWVRLERSGTTITAYKSINGWQWTWVGATNNTTFGANCYIGLCVSSGSATTLNTSSFSNVLVNP